LFKEDPKPIFDHFRNIVIVGVLTLGAGILNKVDIINSPLYVNEIAQCSSWVIMIAVIFLLAINICFAQVSLNKFFFGSTKNKSWQKKALLTIIFYSYTIILAAIIVMYSLNPIVKADSQTLQKSRALS
jgi:heme/copper-type cytochrome/quinol oxidase subunit 4